MFDDGLGVVVEADRESFMSLRTQCEVWVFVVVAATAESAVLDGDVYRLLGGGAMEGDVFIFGHWAF